jgi:hypothetical protein
LNQSSVIEIDDVWEEFARALGRVLELEDSALEDLAVAEAIATSKGATSSLDRFLILAGALGSRFPRARDRLALPDWQRSRSRSSWRIFMRTSWSLHGGASTVEVPDDVRLCTG